MSSLDTITSPMVLGLRGPEGQAAPELLAARDAATAAADSATGAKAIAVASAATARTAVGSVTRNMLALGGDFAALGVATGNTALVAVTDADLIAKGFATGWTDTKTPTTRKAVAVAELPREVRNAPCWIFGRVYVQVDQDDFAPQMEGYLWDPTNAGVAAAFAFVADPDNSPSARARAYTFTCRYTGATPIERILIGASWDAARAVTITGLQVAASTAAPVLGIDPADYPGDYDTGDTAAHARRLARRSLAGPRAFDDRPMGQALAYIRGGIGLVQSGQRDATIVLLGDSQMRHVVDVGFDSTLDSAMVGILEAMGIPATNDSFFGSGGLDFATLKAADPRHAFGAGWGHLDYFAVGGVMIGNSTDTSSWLFTARKSYNRARLYYTTTGNFGTFRARLDGGDWTTVQQGPLAQGVATVDIVAPVYGPHVLEIQRVSGTVGAIHIDCVSDKRQVRILNMGQSGQNAIALAAINAPYAGSYGQLPPALLQPDLTLINIGSNDVIQGLDLAASLAAMEQIIGVPKSTTRDVALIQPTPADPGTMAPAMDAARRRLIEQAARRTSTPILADIVRHWGPWSTAQTVGNVQDAIGHPSGGGRWALARILVNAITGAA